jgi:hypothetical protein
MNHLSRIFLILFPNLVGAAPQIGYAQATGYYKQDTLPMVYQPLHLLDGREGTSWCSTGPDAFEETLMFGFKGVTTIDEIRIYTGNGLDDSTFHEFGRAKKLVIRAAHGGQNLSVKDQRGLQTIALRPPLTGIEFTLEIVDQYAAPDPEMPVCLTDVVFYAEGKPLNGPWLAPKLRYDPNQTPLLGTWFAGPDGAADRFLSFFLDGTYRFTYEPYEPNAKGLSFGGSYQALHSNLLLEIPGKGRFAVTPRQERTEPSTGGKRTLMLEGDVPEEIWQLYRDHL